MTPTAYIPVPLSVPPNEDGWYAFLLEDGTISPFKGVYQKGKWEASGTQGVTHWLRPVDLSKMLEEAWNAGQLRLQQEIWHQDYDPSGEPKAPDLEKYLSSLNNQK